MEEGGEFYDPFAEVFEFDMSECITVEDDRDFGTKVLRNQDDSDSDV